MNASSKRASSNDERRVRAAELKAAHERADRRRRRLIVVIFAVVVLALIVPVAVVLVRSAQQTAQVQEAASAPIEGEEVVEVPTSTHVTEDVPYEAAQVLPEDGTLLPPLGGDHDAIVQNCGFYSAPVRSENAVHSLEHGAVWIAYAPSLGAEQVAALQDLAGANPYLLVSPFDDLASSVVATAWGVQLEMDSVDDERLEPFVARYIQGEQTPEPGAPCSGGTDATVA